MNRPAAIAAAIYIAVATGILVNESRSAAPGQWIELKNLVAFLVTFPISAPLEFLGVLPDLGNTAVLALLVAICAAMIYGVVAGIARLVTSR